ncbi:hypothetical protein CEXT_175531 [Caerostris extrusa]|uniref:Uncharacterized protein n=1 Tax=Caerostris extrusa TaxID=172846 RepID=A0AAV4TZG7_CAEEX|nr:hypothetical protein CEXT_175531 [Caerostris extrusa]
MATSRISCMINRRTVSLTLERTPYGNVSKWDSDFLLRELWRLHLFHSSTPSLPYVRFLRVTLLARTEIEGGKMEGFSISLFPKRSAPSPKSYSSWGDKRPSPISP